MDTAALLETTRRESEALAAAADAADLGTPVPTCPDWTMSGLVTHLAHVQLWVTRILETRATERPSFKDLPPPPEDPTRLTGWFRDATARLCTLLGTIDPATPVWAFGHVRTPEFWVRRQAHEATIHRWDGENATAAARPLPAALAVDGVDELFTLHGLRDATRLSGNGETIRLCCTDADAEWVARLGAGGLEVRREPGKGDAAARGTASDLDLFLWGRLPASRVEVFGDAELLGRFQRLTAL